MNLQSTSYFIIFRNNYVNNTNEDDGENIQIISSIKNDINKIDIDFINYFIKNINKFYEIILQNLLNDLTWNTNYIIINGKKCKQRRMICHMSDGELNYKYSGINNKSIPFNSIVYLLKKYTEYILNNNELSQKINNNKEYNFNYCLLNLYNNGEDYIGMHSDDESDLTPFSPIVSLSLGETRHFDIHHKNNNDKYRYDLNFGDIAVMGGEFQKKFKHGIPMQKKITKPRISLTFRNIVNN